MNTIKPILAALALTFAATAGAQTLKMEPQVVGVTTYEASTAVNLVVVKPEIKLDNLDPSIFTVNTNGTERNVLTVYPMVAIEIYFVTLIAQLNHFGLEHTITFGAVKPVILIFINGVDALSDIVFGMLYRI